VIAKREIAMMDKKNQNIENSIPADSEALRDRLKKLNHDVRNPINGIVGMASLLIDEEDFVKVRTDDIVLIKESAETIIGLIDEVLTDLQLKKTEEGDEDRVLVVSILKKIKRLYNPLVQEKDLTFTFSNQFDAGIMIPHSLSVKLQQIIGNLVSNAIKFTSANGFIDVITAQVASRNQKMLNIIVEDNGIGMNSEQIEAFNNGEPIARSVGTNGEPSFGIGLQHVRKLVHNEGGSITVTSMLTIGTKFSVLLPLQDQPTHS
jgi:signal transduction histidine kinase